MKFEMMYQGRMLASDLMMHAMRNDIDENVTTFLRQTKHCRFEVGFFDSNLTPLYTEFEGTIRPQKTFYIDKGSCYVVIRDKEAPLGIRYIVLKENELKSAMQALRLKIVGYLFISFLLMGIVGYFLGRLFLRPVREQIEALDRFVADTTHELNTPISAILMTIRSLKGCDEKKIKRLEASAKRLHMTYSSLTYRLEGKDDEIEKFDFSETIKERIEYMKELIESKRLRLEVACEPLVVEMSRTSAQRLIDNLLSNAVKYTDIGDTIRVTVHQRSLIVEDTGIGIDKSVREDIFKRYKRADTERGGFGIGLNIVLRICKQYNITLALDSEKGKGSRFVLTFPK